MQLRFDHTHGVYSVKTDTVLCEVFCTPTTETPQWLFEHGWLPTVDGEWYQARSARIPIEGDVLNTSELSITTDGDWRRILDISPEYYHNLNLNHIEFCVRTSAKLMYIDGAAFFTLNIFDGVPYIGTTIGVRKMQEQLQYKSVMLVDVIISKVRDVLKTDLATNANFLYIGEWYPQFDFKRRYEGFEYWNGTRWTSVEL